jgi:hypothetical protein
MNFKLIFFALIVGIAFACKKDDPEPPGNNTPDGPQLIFKIKLDSTQARLDAFGDPINIPSGHDAQSPRFNEVSLHYIELAPNKHTQLSDGEIVYQGATTPHGGANPDPADFDKSIKVGDGDVFYSANLKDVDPGDYKWARVSLIYQNYDVDFRMDDPQNPQNQLKIVGTLASFVGYNTYINSYIINSESVQVSGNKLQGYWGWEAASQVIEGQAPVTTVPNPLHSSSQIPPGSCVVTGEFVQPFTITGDETEDVIVELSFSIQNSFEWSDDLDNDILEPLDGDTVVDMGIRGLIPSQVQ